MQRESKQMKPAQDKLTILVEQYRKFYPDEYKFVCKQISQKRDNQKNKFAQTNMDYIERALTEVPETLFGIFQKHLTEDEIQYYASKQGTTWFAQKFPEFRVGDKL